MDLTRPTSPTADHLISLKEIKTGNVHLDQMVRPGQVSSENVNLNPLVKQIYRTKKCFFCPEVPVKALTPDDLG